MSDHPAKLKNDDCAYPCVIWASKINQVVCRQTCAYVAEAIICQETGCNSPWYLYRGLDVKEIETQIVAGFRVGWTYSIFNCPEPIRTINQRRVKTMAKHRCRYLDKNTDKDECLKMSSASVLALETCLKECKPPWSLPCPICFRHFGEQSLVIPGCAVTTQLRCGGHQDNEVDKRVGNSGYAEMYGLSGLPGGASESEKTSPAKPEPPVYACPMFESAIDQLICQANFKTCQQLGCDCEQLNKVQAVAVVEIDANPEPIVPPPELVLSVTSEILDSETQATSIMPLELLSDEVELALPPPDTTCPVIEASAAAVELNSLSVKENLLVEHKRLRPAASIQQAISNIDEAELERLVDQLRTNGQEQAVKVVVLDFGSYEIQDPEDFKLWLAAQYAGLPKIKISVWEEFQERSVYQEDRPQLSEAAIIGGLFPPDRQRTEADSTRLLITNPAQPTSPSFSPLPADLVITVIASPSPVTVQSSVSSVTPKQPKATKVETVDKSLSEREVSMMQLAKEVTERGNVLEIALTIQLWQLKYEPHFRLFEKYFNKSATWLRQRRLVLHLHADILTRFNPNLPEAQRPALWPLVCLANVKQLALQPSLLTQIEQHQLPNSSVDNWLKRSGAYKAPAEPKATEPWVELIKFNWFEVSMELAEFLGIAIVDEPVISPPVSSPAESAAPALTFACPHWFEVDEAFCTVKNFYCNGKCGSPWKRLESAETLVEPVITLSPKHLLEEVLHVGNWARLDELYPSRFLPERQWSGAEVDTAAFSLVNKTVTSIKVTAVEGGFEALVDPVILDGAEMIGETQLKVEILEFETELDEQFYVTVLNQHLFLDLELGQFFLLLKQQGLIYHEIAEEFALPFPEIRNRVLFLSKLSPRILALMERTTPDAQRPTYAEAVELMHLAKQSQFRQFEKWRNSP